MSKSKLTENDRLKTSLALFEFVAKNISPEFVEAMNNDFEEGRREEGLKKAQIILDAVDELAARKAENPEAKIRWKRVKLANDG